MRWVQGHISHCSRVSRRCHPERSLCSGEFDCCSFIKHSPWTVCFLLVMWKTCVFLWATIRPSFNVHFTFRFCIRESKTSDRQLLQTVNFHGISLWWFDIFDSFCLVQPMRLFEPFWQGFWLAYCSVLCEGIEHAYDTVVQFGNKVCFINWK